MKCPGCGEIYEECGRCDAMVCSCDPCECLDDFDADELGLDPEEPYDYA